MRKKDGSDEARKQRPVEAIDGPGELPCTHTALRRAARQLGHIYDEALAPTELKATQIGMLAQIDRLGGQEGPTLQTLADEVAVRISALTHALRPLVRDGLVELNADDHDKRTKHAALTAAGKQRLKEGFLLWQSVNRRIESVLGSKSANLLRALADQVSSTDFLDAYNRDRAMALGKTPS